MAACRFFTQHMFARPEHLDSLPCMLARRRRNVNCVALFTAREFLQRRKDKPTTVLFSVLSGSLSGPAVNSSKGKPWHLLCLLQECVHDEIGADCGKPHRALW